MPDESIRRRGLCRFDDFLVRSVQTPVADVLHDRTGKEMGLLQDHGDIFPKLIAVVMPDLHAVDRDRTLLYIIEARKQVHDRCLAGAGRSDKGDLLSGMGIEADIL